MRDLDLAWRLCRGVVSNAIVLVKDGMEIGLARARPVASTPPARLWPRPSPSTAQSPARRRLRLRRFLPVPDAVQVCLDAGVTVFAQPGGSIHDAEAIEVAEKAGASMR